MAIPTLMLSPERQGYSTSLADGVISTETEIGMPRQRIGSVGNVHKASPTYRCQQAQYNYLMAFLRVYRGLPFLSLQHFDDGEPKLYETRIIGEIKTSVVGYGVIDVSFNVVCKPNYYDIVISSDIIAIFEMTGGKPDEFYNYLEKLVNQDLPKAMLKVESINTQIDYSVPDLIKSLDTFDYVSMSGGNQQASGDNFKSLTNTDLPSAMTGTENISG